MLAAAKFMHQPKNFQRNRIIFDIRLHTLCDDASLGAKRNPQKPTEPGTAQTDDTTHEISPKKLKSFFVQSMTF